jgi:hypothetical protein
VACGRGSVGLGLAGCAGKEGRADAGGSGTVFYARAGEGGWRRDGPMATLLLTCFYFVAGIPIG